MKYFILAIFLNSLAISFAHADALEWANGAWGVDVENIPERLDAMKLDELRGCYSSPVLISTDRETMRYKAVHTGEADLTAEAPILAAEKKWISLRYDDETRLMKNGESQIWHMFFTSEDKFYWIVGPSIRKDERDGVVSVARVRCKTLVG